jgi:hypothetical protein
MSAKKPARGKSTPASNAGSYKTYAHGAPDIDLGLDADTDPASDGFAPADESGPGQDDLDFARETLGPLATHEEVRALAEERYDRDRKELEREAKAEEVRARLAATDFPEDEDPLAEARAESVVEERLRRYAATGLPETPNLSGYEEIDDIDTRWRGGFGVTTAKRLTNDDLAAYAAQVLATHRVRGDKPADVHMRALYGELQNALDQYATRGTNPGPVDPDALGGEIIGALQAIADQRVTDQITAYGPDSTVFKPWDQIHADYRSTGNESWGGRDGVRRAMTLDSRTGGTVLTPWLGPKVLADYRERHIEETEAVENMLDEFHKARAAAAKGDRLAKNRFLLVHDWTQDEIDKIWDAGFDEGSDALIDQRLDHAMEQTMRQDIENARSRGLPVEELHRQFNIAIGRPWDN